MIPNQPYPSQFQTVEVPWIHRPAEFVREPGVPKGWYQDGRKLRNVKTSFAFVWPKDGKNGSKWGRLTDIFTNQGPDIFVGLGARKVDCAVNACTRDQWSGHSDLDGRGTTYEFNSKKYAPWTANGVLGGRTPNLSYDFRTRKYGRRHRQMWTDAIWQPDPYKNRKWNSYPEAVRNIYGRWHQDLQYTPQFLGGPTSNEFADGFYGEHLPDFFRL